MKNPNFGPEITLNFDSIINNSMQVLCDNPELVSQRGMDIGDTPIFPMALDDDYTPMLFIPEVMKSYKRLVSVINIPETAKENSFVLLVILKKRQITH